MKSLISMRNSFILIAFLMLSRVLFIKADTGTWLSFVVVMLILAFCGWMAYLQRQIFYDIFKENQAALLVLFLLILLIAALMWW